MSMYEDTDLVKQELSEENSKDYPDYKVEYDSYKEVKSKRPGRIPLKNKKGSKGSKLHQCSECDMEFKSKMGLIYHKSSIHEGKKPHTCKLCNASFTQSCNLKTHISTVHE